MYPASKKYLMFSEFHNSRRAAIVMVIIVCLAGCSQSLSAQRTANGQSMVSISAAPSMLRPQEVGAVVAYGQYLLAGYWTAGAQGGMHTLIISSGTRMRYLDMIFGGGYMHRLVGTRSRRISLYAGGEAFLGFETYDPMSELPSNIDTGLPSGSFLYGIAPQVVAEIFLTGKLALVAGCSSPVNFSSPITMVRPNLIVGLRMNI